MTATLVRHQEVIVTAELQEILTRLADTTAKYGYDISPEFNPLSTMKDFESGHSCTITKEQSSTPELDAVLMELAAMCAELEIAVHVEFKPKTDFGNKSYPRMGFSCFLAPCPPNPACFIIC